MDPKTLAVNKELAERILSRRRLIPFTKRINPRYHAGWVHEDIARRLERFSEEVDKGLSPRLMLLMPPRSGKSELASRMFPAWHLGRYPDHEVIACSYNVALAMSFSRKVKETIEDPSYQGVFTTRLNPNFQGAEEWGISGARGGYVAAGVGGGINGKGAHCLPTGTLVETEDGPIDIAHLYQLNSLPRITTPLGPKRALAITRREETELFRLVFASGKTLTVTGAHPIYLPDAGRYVPAQELYGTSKNTDQPDVRVVRIAVPTRPRRSQQVAEAELHGVLLQQGVQSSAPRGETRQDVQDMWQAGSADAGEPQFKILLEGVPAEALPPQGENLPGMRRGISAKDFATGLLRGELRTYGARETNDWEGEFALQGRQFVRVLVRPDAQNNSGEGSRLRGVHVDDTASLPPHQRERTGQQPGKSRDDVQYSPYRAPQVAYDTISLVEHRCNDPVTVYDLQVEDAGCFFADEVLTGNCLIIDDPLKNAEEADSGELREKIWDWYGSTAYTRLAPGGGVLIVQTWWHDDDLAGRLQEAMRADPEADQFEVVKYPAIAEYDEFLDTSTDEIVRLELNLPEVGEDETSFDAAVTSALAEKRVQTLGLDVSRLKFLRRKGEALHPERYDLVKLNRIRKTIPPRFWSALYQQNPVPDDGEYFKKDQFRRAAVPPIKRCNVFIAWDFAISEKKQNDYTVGTVALQDDDDLLHIADMVRFRSGDAFYIVEAILDLCQKWYSPTLMLGFEDGQIYRAIESVLKKRMHERRVYPAITALKPITDKLARARAIQGRMQQGKVSFSDVGGWFDVMKAEMLRFPAGVHDDCVDSAAWVAQLAVSRPPPAKPRVQHLKSWKDRLTAGAVGSVSHMAA